MDIYSTKFWRAVALLLLLDLFLIEITFHHGMQTNTSKEYWDFRIQELRQIEATPRIQALNGVLQNSQTDGDLLLPQWLNTYFPGLSVPLTTSDTWRLNLPRTENPADRAGKVL